MCYISNFRKVKLFALLILVLAAPVLAGEGIMNYYGQLGVHKTQSAQTLGHGRFGIGTFAEGTGLHSIIGNERLCVPPGKDIDGGDPITCVNPLPLGDQFMGFNAYPFLSLGLSNYFDFSVSMPMYGETLRVKNIDDNGKEIIDTDDLGSFGWGDLHISTKIRAPFNEEFPLDLALLLGLSISTGRASSGETDSYGLWVHDPIFLNTNEESPPIAYPNASIYTNGNTVLKLGAALTFDFNRMKAKFPLMVHLNYTHRMALGSEGNNYPVVQSVATALELTPVKYISIFGEYYIDMVNKFPKGSDGEEGFAETSTFATGVSFNFNKNVALQVGFQMLLGDDDKYIYNLNRPMSGSFARYNAALIPKTMVFGGLAFKIFTMEPVEEVEEYRNPDTDEDGVCDPWVAETGRQREFSRECKGIDLCPYEPGPLENKGCPVEGDELPTVLFTANPDIVQKGQSVTLSWQVSNATEVSIDGIGTVEASGTRKVKPTENTTYTLSATNAGGTRTSKVEVEVAAGILPTVFFTASPDVVQKGQSTTLNWKVTDANEVGIDGGQIPVGNVPLSGSRRIKISENTVFTLTAIGDGGTKRETVEIEVTAGPVPVILFSANPETMQRGQTAKLTWQVTNATEVSIDGGIGDVKAKGTRQVKPDESIVYTLTAVGEGGTQTETVEIEVTDPPPIEAKVNLQGVTFGTGNATLTSNAKKVLDGVADQLLQNPKVKIEIQGHTDNQGSAKSNQELSERRAKAVIGYLATKGIKMSRMSAAGFGQDVPIADNKTSDGREQNRRIEMIRVDD